MLNGRLGYQEFKMELKRQVEERVGDGVTVSFRTSVKNNQTEKEAITFQEEVWEQAENNLNRTEYFIEDVEKIILQAFGGKTSLREEGEAGIQYAVSNTEHMDGAVGILKKGLLESFARQINQNFYIIPSSTQEIIFTPEKCGIEKEYLDEIVKEVNAYTVSEEERLSDHVYYYDRRTGKIKM